MLERLRRVLVSVPREPPRDASPGSSGQGTRLLDAFDASTPHRYRTWLTDPADKARLPDGLSAPHVRGVEVAVVDEPDGRVALEVVTLAGPRTWRILEPLDVLHAAGIDVRGFEPLDVASEVDDDELRRTVEGREAEVQGQNTYLRRLEALAGERLLARSLAEWSKAAERHGSEFLSFAWRDAAVGTAFNTPGGEVALIEKALSLSNDHASWGFMEGAFRRIRLCARTGLPFELSEAKTLNLVSRRGSAGSTAIRGLEYLPGPLPGRVVEALPTACSPRTRDARGRMHRRLAGREPVDRRNLRLWSGGAIHP